jgi:hypothetical protein
MNHEPSTISFSREELRQGPLQSQQAPLGPESAGKAAQGGVLGNDPMTGYDDWHGIGPQGMPHRPSIACPTDSKRHPFVRSDASIRDTENRSPDPTLECRPSRQVNRKVQSTPLPLKKSDQLCASLRHKNRKA